MALADQPESYVNRWRHGTAGYSNPDRLFEFAHIDIAIGGHFFDDLVNRSLAPVLEARQPVFRRDRRLEYHRP